MADFNLSPSAQVLVNGILLWIGFATVVALIVRSFFPGKEPSGFLGTLLIGVGGCCIGPLGLTLIWKLKSETFNPISPIGFLASLVCAAGLLLGYQAILGILRRDKG